METQIDLKAAQLFCKVIQAPQNTYMRQKVLKYLQNYELLAEYFWLTHTARMLIHYQLEEQLPVMGIDSPHPEYVEPSPWAQTFLEFSIKRLSRNKIQYSMSSLKAEAHRVITAIIPPDSRTYFMNRSLDPISNTASTSFAAKDATKSMRLTDNAFLLQAETVGIMGALTHVSIGEGHVVIYTDSMAAIDSLQHSICHSLLATQSKSQNIPLSQMVLRHHRV